MWACLYFFFSSRRRHTRSLRDWSSDVCSSDAACDCQAEAVAVGSAEVGAVEPGEALEDAFPVGFRDAGPCVGDFDLDAGGVAGDADGDLAAVGGGVPRVAQEVVQDLPDAFGVAVQVDVAGSVQLDVDCRREFAGLPGCGCGEWHEVKVFAVQRDSLFQAGDGEQVVDEPPGAVALAQDLQDQFLAGGGVGAGAQQCLCAGLDACDRGAELVGRVGQEPAHAFFGAAQGAGFGDCG